MLLVLLDPCNRLTVEGATPKLKFGPGVTDKLTVVAWARLPAVPEIVTVLEPTVARLLAASVNTLVPVVGLVPNDAVTPDGRPVAARFTLPEKPFSGVTVIVFVPLDPCAMLTLFGVADKLKFGPGVIVKLTVVACTRLPLVPVMFPVAGPTVAVLLTLRVNTLVLVVGLVPNEAVTPEGRPVADRFTLPEKPFK